MVNMDILVNSLTPPRRFAPDNVYLAFIDGSLSYDCRTCGAQCCRGHGYNLDAEREVSLHLATESRVRFFIDPCDAAANHYHVRNASPGCFFLSQQNLCSLEIRQGYAAKPGTCRLFPFNNIITCGDYLVVQPHPSLCPLEVAPPDALSAHSNHQAVISGLALHGIDQDVEGAAVGGHDAATLISMERFVSELCRDNSSIPYSHLASLQSHAAAPTLGQRWTSTSPEDFDQLGRDILDVLGADSGDCRNASVTRVMAVITPALRARLVFRPQRHKTLQSDIGRVPHTLLALEILAQLASAAGMQRVSFQTVSRLLDDNTALLFTLARLRHAVCWRTDRPVDLSFSGPDDQRLAYATVAKALVPRTQRRSPRLLVDVLRTVLPENELSRLTFVRRLSRKLNGMLTDLDEFDRRTARVALQHVGIATLPVDAMARLVATSTARRITREPNDGRRRKPSTIS